MIQCDPLVWNNAVGKDSRQHPLLGSGPVRAVGSPAAGMAGVPGGHVECWGSSTYLFPTVGIPSGLQASPSQLFCFPLYAAILSLCVRGLCYFLAKF